MAVVCSSSSYVKPLCSDIVQGIDRGGASRSVTEFGEDLNVEPLWIFYRTYVRQTSNLSLYRTYFCLLNIKKGDITINRVTFHGSEQQSAHL